MLKASKDFTLLDVIEDGIQEAELLGVEGFDYIVGRVQGGTITVSFCPDDKSAFESIQIDGVDGFGYTLVVEE